MGVVFTDQVSHNFDVGPSSSGTSVIRDKGPSGKGPKYFASATLYSLPRQIESIFNGRPFHGRDILRDNGWEDRLGAFIGVGLSDPGKEFYVGTTFELLNGVNVIGGVRWSRVTELNGVSVGQAFSGTASDIPVTDNWKKTFVLGVSLDLKYVTDLFKRT